MSIEELTPKARVNLIRDALAAMYPARKVTRNLLAYNDYSDAELEAGIYQIVSLGESDFRNYNGREAADGNHRILLVGLLKLGEKDNGEDIEDAEFAMVEEIKAFLRSPAPARPAELCCLSARGYQTSGQLDHPHGAVAFDLECRDNE